MGCGSSGGGQNTVVQSSQPPASVLAAYNNVVNAAQNVAKQPLQQYNGPLVAGFTPQQNQAMSTVQNAQGMAQPYINAAAQYVGQGAAPIASEIPQFSAGNVQQYMSPYTQNVVSTTEAQMNQQNAIQQQQLQGNAVAAGAYGGDRLAVAQGVLGGQQALQESQTIAGLENQGYSQALGEFNTQQQTNLQALEGQSWLAENAGYALGGLGTSAEQTALSGASAELQTGALQQQLAQEQLNVPYEQFQQQQAYPFQTTQYLAGITEGIGSQSGGTSSTQYPGASALSQVGGLGLAGLGLAGQSGLLSGLGGAATTSALADLAAGTTAGNLSAGLFLNAVGAVAERGGRIPHHADGDRVQHFDNGGTVVQPYPINGLGSGVPQIGNFVPGGSLSGGRGGMGIPRPPMPSQQQQPQLYNALQGAGLDYLAKGGAQGLQDLIGSFNTGGRVGYDDGGGIAPNPGAAPPAQFGGNPQLQSLYQRYAQLPQEKLQELMVRIPPQSPQRAMIARALQAKQMAPASTTPQQPQQQPGIAAPMAPTGQPMQPMQQVQPQGFATGGAPDGGATKLFPGLAHWQSLAAGGAGSTPTQGGSGGTGGAVTGTGGGVVGTPAAPIATAVAPTVTAAPTVASAPAAAAPPSLGNFGNYIASPTGVAIPQFNQNVFAGPTAAQSAAASGGISGMGNQYNPLPQIPLSSMPPPTVIPQTQWAKPTTTTTGSTGSAAVAPGTDPTVNQAIVNSYAMGSEHGHRRGGRVGYDDGGGVYGNPEIDQALQGLMIPIPRSERPYDTSAGAFMPPPSAGGPPLAIPGYGGNPEVDRALQARMVPIPAVERHPPSIAPIADQSVPGEGRILAGPSSTMGPDEMPKVPSIAGAVPQGLGTTPQQVADRRGIPAPPPASAMMPGAEAANEPLTQTTPITGEPGTTTTHTVNGDPWGALAAAGFATMAGRSPQALVNLGQGGLEGMRYMQAQKNQELHQQDLAAERTIRQQEADIRGMDAKTAAGRLSEEINYHAGQLTNEGKRTANEETKAENEAMYRQGLLEQSRYGAPFIGADGNYYVHDTRHNTVTPLNIPAGARPAVEKDATDRAIGYLNQSELPGWLSRPDAQEKINNVTQLLGQRGGGGQQQAAPAQAPAAGGPATPARPASVPAGSAWSPSRGQWRDPTGRIYNAQGQPLS